MGTRADAAVWGLISDVHGNLPALERAVAGLRAAGAERLAFLGDYLGRGDADGCVRLIRQLADVAVVGNRDLDWQARVAPETAAWVLGLPRRVRVGPLLLAHGDPRLTRELSTDQIRRDFLQAWRELRREGATVLAFGHSHHARLWRKAAAEGPAEPLDGPEAPLEPGYAYFVNVGTTGLPFPGKGGPSVALVDLPGQRLALLPVQ